MSQTLRQDAVTGPAARLTANQVQHCRERILATTVYFATNRVVTNASDADKGYTSIMVPPLKPQEITYGAAIVDGINVATNAWEPLVLARKPMVGNLAQNLLKHGTGAINIDATRIGYVSD